MKVLVIGGGGFIGSHIVDELIARNVQVRVYGRNLVKYNDAAELFVGDFLDIPKLAEALVGIDVVVHSLSTMVPATSALAPEDDVKSNLIGTMKLLDLMRRRDISRLIYLSSGGTVYGNPLTDPVAETALLNPISTYGAVKVAIEAFIGVAQSEWGLKSVIFRPSNPYGERQGGKLAQGLISHLLRSVIQRQPITIFGDGGVVRDYVYVKDLAFLIAQAVESDVCGTFNAGSGIGYSISNIVDVVEKETSYIFEKRYLPSRVFDVGRIVLDCKKVEEEFHWVSSTSIELGVSRQYASMKMVVS